MTEKPNETADLLSSQRIIRVTKNAIRLWWVKKKYVQIVIILGDRVRNQRKMHQSRSDILKINSYLPALG